jgi:hypothetical protein
MVGETVGTDTSIAPTSILVAAMPDEDILHYYPLAKTQQKKAKWPSCSRAATV